MATIMQWAFFTSASHFACSRWVWRGTGGDHGAGRGEHVEGGGVTQAGVGERVLQRPAVPALAQQIRQAGGGGGQDGVAGRACEVRPRAQGSSRNGRILVDREAISSSVSTLWAYHKPTGDFSDITT
ncbi:hypothetical protein [Streptomyces sp. NPDC096030]|uniref:hypothetical protein n=1 Tax=Streptomyces sp. NPDC096030 TaxID=3155423 RepID=UPI003317E65B